MSVADKDVHLVIISGLSGSGKSCALKCFEDLGFFCIDNLPPQLLPKFIDLCRQSRNKIAQAAIGIDIRERTFLSNFLNVYEQLREKGYHMELLFLQAKNEILQRRFSESRRPHPLAQKGTVLEGIEKERKVLLPLQEQANRVIDTSDYHVHQLKETIDHYYLKGSNQQHLNLFLTSFGYKFGVPYDLDLLLDVRFLSNPYAIDKLRPLTGNDPDVQNYVVSLPEAKIFIEKICGLLDFLFPLFKKEGKSYLTIGIGCTGGRHRSVAIVNHLTSYFSNIGIQVHSRHRDVEIDD